MSRLVQMAPEVDRGVRFGYRIWEVPKSSRFSETSEGRTSELHRKSEDRDRTVARDRAGDQVWHKQHAGVLLDGALGC